MRANAKSKPSVEKVLAQIQARFGDLDRVFAALPHLLEVPFGVTRGNLRFDPIWTLCAPIPLSKNPARKSSTDLTYLKKSSPHSH